MKSRFLGLIICFSFNWCFGQNTVTAKLINQITDQPVRSAFIRLESDSSYTTSNYIGFFQFKDINEKVWLNISHPGYIPGLVQAKPNDRLSIKMSPKIHLLPLIDLAMGADIADTLRYSEVGGPIIGWDNLLKSIRKHLIEKGFDTRPNFRAEILLEIDEAGKVAIIESTWADTLLINEIMEVFQSEEKWNPLVVDQVSYVSYANLMILNTDLFYTASDLMPTFLFNELNSSNSRYSLKILPTIDGCYGKQNWNTIINKKGEIISIDSSKNSTECILKFGRYMSKKAVIKPAKIFDVPVNFHLNTPLSFPLDYTNIEIFNPDEMNYRSLGISEDYDEMEKQLGKYLSEYPRIFYQMSTLKGGLDSTYYLFEKGFKKFYNHLPPNRAFNIINGTFQINANGDLEKVNIRGDFGNPMNDEILKFLKQFGKWNPARINGIPVPSKKEISINLNDFSRFEIAQIGFDLNDGINKFEMNELQPALLKFEEVLSKQYNNLDALIYKSKCLFQLGNIKRGCKILDDLEGVTEETSALQKQYCTN